MSSMPIVRIFWSGGFDSSFRMVQLSKQNVTIQPYYICDDLDRRKQRRELQAIASITEDIENNPETNCTILPLIKKRVEDIPHDKQILEAYTRLAKNAGLARQYYWFVSFCKAEYIFGVELGAEKDEHGSIMRCIDACGKVTAINEGNISYYIVDSAASSRDLSLVLGRFRFPIPLFDTTKKQLVELYKEYGYGHVIDKTWFCCRPINGEPCGTCATCRYALRAGMQFRFSDKALERYENYHGRVGLLAWVGKRTNIFAILIRLRLLNVARKMLARLGQTQSQ